MPKVMVSISSKGRENKCGQICPKVWNGFGVAWDEMVSEMGERSMAKEQRGIKIFNRYIEWIE